MTTHSNAWLVALAAEHAAGLARFKADPIAKHNTWQAAQYEQHPRSDDAGLGIENDDTGRDA